MLPEFTAGLDGLSDFDYAWLIRLLHRSTAPASDLHVVPFMLGHTGERLGVFATRHPSRPNPLALSVVRILGIDGGEIRFSGVDWYERTGAAERAQLLPENRGARPPR